MENRVNWGELLRARRIDQRKLDALMKSAQDHMEKYDEAVNTAKEAVSSREEALSSALKSIDDAERTKLSKAAFGKGKISEAAATERQVAQKEFDDEIGVLRDRLERATKERDDAADGHSSLLLSRDSAQLDAKLKTIDEWRKKRVPLPDEEDVSMMFLVGDDDTDLTRATRGFLQLNGVRGPNLAILDPVRQRKYMWARMEPLDVGDEGADEQGGETTVSAAVEGVDQIAGAQVRKPDADVREGGLEESKSGDAAKKDPDSFEGADETKGDELARSSAPSGADGADEVAGAAKARESAVSHGESKDTGNSDDSDEISEDDEDPLEGESEDDDVSPTVRGGGIAPTEREVRHFLRSFKANKLPPWNIFA